MLQVYTDGGTRNLNKPNMVGGFGVVILSGEKKKELYGAVSHATNQQMEIIAMIKALEAIARKDIPIAIHSDSAYAIKGITEWCKEWQRNGWKNSKKQAVANRDLWEELIELYESFSSVKFVKVKGHSGDQWNEYVDMLASKAMDEWESNNSGLRLEADELNATIPTDLRDELFTEVKAIAKSIDFQKGLFQNPMPLKAGDFEEFQKGIGAAMKRMAILGDTVSGICDKINEK